VSQLKDKIQKTITEAMKAKEAARLQTLRLIWNAVRKKEIDERKDLSDAEIEKALLTMIKQTQESLEQAKTANRPDTIAELEAEIQVIKTFLPQALSPAEVDRIVGAIADKLKSSGKLPSGGAAMGAVMKEAMEEIGSRSEGKIIQASVKKALGL
jgi:uncharacterized protein YqeY